MPPTRMALGKLSESHSTFLDSDFPNLSLSNPNRTVYLDTTGAALYSKSQLEAVFADLAQNLYSNPHSCPRTRDKIVAARRRTLRHFLASEDDYAVIFTSGTTASLKLVAESFCWSADSTFAYANESHTSVVGMREIVEAKIETFDNDVPRLGAGTNLVAFPAMSNFCGRKFSLDLIDAIKKAGSGNYVLLDAASHASSAPLDLSRYRPDFVCVSYYKMFGYPTGLGALLVRHEALGMLKAGLPHVREGKRYFGGGTVEMNLVRSQRHEFKKTPEDWLEDGTAAFLDIIAVNHGFDAIERAPGGILGIMEHTHGIARYFYETLVDLKHDSGHRLAEIYCSADFSDPEKQGPIVNFNLLQSDGHSYFGFASFRRLAEAEIMAVRTGCFCNIGACQRLKGGQTLAKSTKLTLYLKMTDADVLSNHNQGHVCGDDVDLINGKPVGSIRVSFGYYSRKEDADAVLNLLRRHFLKDSRTTTTDAPLRSGSARLDQILLYPVKSCAPMRVNSWRMGATGLEMDRHWAIMKGRKAVTQKELRCLCLVKPYLDLDAETLTLSFPGMTPILLPLRPNKEEYSNEHDVCLGRVCGDRMEGVECGGADVSEWLEEATGETGLKLVRLMSRSSRRNVGKQQQLSLANSGQLLVLNKNSGLDLASKIDRDVDWTLKQFRGNLVIEGCSDGSWTNLTVGGGVRLKRVMDCTRCGMIRIDQRDGCDNDAIYNEMMTHPEKAFSFGVLYDIDRFDQDRKNTVTIGDHVSVD